ncbi:hypothetical protein [Nocardioides aromaticivorans]|uniref:hypothetical protein n=1 Tax=Nocardioides aromaticivorans TaxID=200618 RepID=UPI001A8FF9CE|nr:hypothetical protein [Nocardioides aromaticivorans]
MTTYTLRSARSRRWSPALLAALLLGSLVPLSTAVAPTSQADSATRLSGVFRLAPGSCAGGRISGTYLRMILPSGTTNGPYMSNADSPCSDQSFTPLGAGTDGGLSTVGYQPAPKPAFDSSGNARAGRITARAQYYGTAFATATAGKEPQTGRSVPVPSVTLRGNRLTADLRAFTVSWNKQYFNQGAPKPDGSTPGNTTLATGTYDRATGRFTLDWASQVQGGPFDKFTGKWHLEGVFVPAGSSGSGGSSGAGTGSTGQPGTTSQGSGTGAQPGAVEPGEAPAPGQAPAAGDPLAGTPGAPITPGAPLAATDAGSVSAGAPGTRTVTQRHKEWQVSGPLTATAIGLAVLAVGLIVGTRILERRARKAAAA